MRNSLLLTLVVLGLTACGEAYRSNTPESVASAPLTPDPGDPADPADPTDPNPVDPEKVPTKVSTAMGTLTYNLESKDSSGHTYTYDLKVPYGRVFKVTSGLTRWLLPQACAWVKGIKKENPSEYRAGEIPCGEIVNGSRKELLELNIKDYSDNHSGFKVKVEGFKLPIYMERAGRRGVYQEDSLDTKSVEALNSSTQFGEDISFRYVPNSIEARMEVCMNIPGTEISAPSRKIHAKASKKILGIGFSYSSNFTVDPGEASYDYGRGCFLANVNWTSAQTSPKIELKVSKNPYLQDVKYKGLKIKINDWFLRLVDKIVTFFRGSIRKEVIRNLTDKVNDIADRDVETGKWFSRTHADDVLLQTGSRLSDRINRIIARSGTPTSPAAVKKLLKDQCRLLKFAGSAQWTAKVESLCRDHLDKVEIRVERFAVDADSQGAGCYKHFANIHKSQGKWWANTCKFSTRFTAKLPSSIQDFNQELAALLKEHLSLSAIPAEWKERLAELKVDAYTLSLLLEELEARGYDQILMSDWDRRIPDILQEVRLKLIAWKI